MAAYKLTYFNARGTTEPTRFLFAYGNIKFEDIRVTSEEWAKLKPKTPSGFLPILEHNGKIVDQSAAIARYAATLVGLRGKDAWEDLQSDAIVDSFGDIGKKISPIYSETDEEKKKAIVKKVYDEFFPRFDKLATETGHLANGKLTWADIYFVSQRASMESILSDALKPYEGLRKLIQKVESISEIKKWIESRPKTSY